MHARPAATPFHPPARRGDARRLLRCAIALAGLVVVGATGCYHADVAPGEVGVVSTPDGISPAPLSEGTWAIGAYDRVTKYDVRSQERSDRVEAQAADGVPLVLDVSVRFHVVAAEVVALEKEIGVEYYEILVQPTVRAQLRRAVGRFTSEQVQGTQRDAIERQVREGSGSALAGRHLQIEAVSFRRISATGPPVPVAPPPPPPEGDGSGRLGQPSLDPATLQRLQQLGSMPPRLGIATADQPGGGVVVVEVMQASPSVGKLRAGDVILAVDDAPIANVVDLVLAVQAHRYAALRMQVKRGSATVSVTVEPAP